MPNELAEIFAEWNKGDLDSYLIDITAQIFRKIDPDTGKPLVDVILDKAGQKGTGIWTLQSAIQRSVVISTINAAVEARVISSRKEERVAAAASSAAAEGPNIQGTTGSLDSRGAKTRFTPPRLFPMPRGWNYSAPPARNLAGI